MITRVLAAAFAAAVITLPPLKAAGDYDSRYGCLEYYPMYYEDAALYWTPLGQPYYYPPHSVYHLLRGHDPYPPPPLWAVFPEVPAAWKNYYEDMFFIPEYTEAGPRFDEPALPPEAYKSLADARSEEPGVRMVAVDINNGRVDFFNLGKRLSPMKNAEYASGEGAVDAVAADFNGDGVADAAVVNYFEDSMTVILRGADGGERRYGYRTGGQPSAITSADFNGDGVTDLAVANSGSDTVTVFFGRGNGGFGRAGGFRTGDRPEAVTAADMDGNGAPDILTANFEGRSISLIMGNGYGTFGSALEYPVQGSPKAIAAADFDRDGLPDVAVTDWLGSKVYLLFGNGHGGFRKTTAAAVGHTPESLAAADLDMDGNLDIIFSSVMDEGVGALFGRGDGTFRPYRELGSFPAPRAVAAKRLDGDSRPHVAVTDEDNESLYFVAGGRMADLEVSFDPEMGSVRPARGSYALGTVVKLEADAKPGYRFVGWTGSVKERKLPITSIKVRKNEKIMAVFEEEALR